MYLYLIFRDPSALPADYFKSSPKAKIEMDMRIKSDELNQEFSKEIQDSDSLIRTKVWTSQREITPITYTLRYGGGVGRSKGDNTYYIEIRFPACLEITQTS